MYLQHWAHWRMQSRSVVAEMGRTFHSWSVASVAEKSKIELSEYCEINLNNNLMHNMLQESTNIEIGILQLNRLKCLSILALTHRCCETIL
jgi:hypothetical protein